MYMIGSILSCGILQVGELRNASTHGCTVEATPKGATTVMISRGAARVQLT